MTSLPTAENIHTAAKRIADHVKRTPLLRSDVLDQMTGGTVLLKAECLQKTGSFKIRGATNRILQLTDTEKKNGVVAWSSGNHALGVAAAAKGLDLPAKIVMPSDAPRAKIENTKDLGAEIIFYDRATEDRYAIAMTIADEEGRAVVPPYNHRDTICGQGTVGLELSHQADELGISIDDVLVPVSGGGLMAGVGLAVKHYFPEAHLYTVEPEGFDDHRRSLESGKREKNANMAGSLCDALLALTPGELTWAINKQQLTSGYAIDDEKVLAAMAFANEHLRLRLEPGGAVALAALLAGNHQTTNRCVAVILSGGNVDDQTFNLALSDN